MSTRSQRRSLYVALSAGLLASLAVTLWQSDRPVNAGGRQPTPPAADAVDRAADRAGIAAQMNGFVSAFEGGDADKVAAFWTPEGELIGEDGTAYRGRAAIADAYRELFGAREKRQAEVRQESLRFPSRDTAVEEGYFKVRVGEGEPTTSRYSVLHVREGGRWLMAVVREWPAQAASLHDLEWLVGTWVAKRDDAEVRTTYEWLWDKTFLRVTFTVRAKDRELSGFQMIGRDPASGELRAWTFESEGGFGEATWTRDGKAWLVESAGRLNDGTTLEATNLLTPVNGESFTWQTVRRVVDGEEVGDLPPVRVTRVRQKQ